MSIQARRERERAEREKLIVTAARELAEAEGWDAVTTRRSPDCWSGVAVADAMRWYLLVERGCGIHRRGADVT